MDLFQKCKELYEKIRYFEYGIPVDGVIKGVPSAEYFVKNYHFLKPEEFEKYGGGICWDYVEYERKFLEVNDIDFNQYYLITNTPPNYDTHTFITVKDGDDLIYIESSFKRVEHIIDGVQKFKSLEDIVKLITTNMWYCNDNDKHFDEFKYDVCKFKGHPQYGCTCQEYMDWMDNNSDIVIQDVSINPKKVNEDELPVEEFSVNKIDTKFTQFVCESVNDPEEYDETLHDHIADEDDVYNESSVLKFPKKVNNVPFDIMYFGSNIDFGNESIKLDHNELFLTPYIGLASIFITDRKEYFKPLPKDRPHNTNIGYDEWGLSPSELQKPLKEVHVSLDDIPNVTPFEFDYTGYIYAIDVSQYKDNLYQKDWMTSDREFILKDINPVPIKEKIKWTHHVYVRGGKNTDDVYNESWTDFKNGVHPSSGLMFHVSLKNDMDGKTITPQLPSYITDGGELDDNYQEDTKTKRLCVSPSIEGCLIAILNYNKIREHVGDKFYVYTPEKPFSQYKHKTNKEIVKDKLVFDANITKEAWILEPCKLKLYGIIKLKKVKDLKKKPTVEKNIKMNTIKLDYEWIMTPKASGKFNKAIGDSPDDESNKKEKPIKEYTAIMEGFYDDKAKSHSGGVYGIYDLSDDYSTNFCNIILQGHNTEYLGWNAPKGEELIRKTFEVVRSEEWTFDKSDRNNVIPDYSNIFTYASQILPIIRLDALGEEHIKDLKAPSTLFTVHDPNSDTDIKYLCVIPQVLDVIDKSKTSYVYDEGMDDLFADHIVYNSDLIDRLGMFRVKHNHPVAGTYDDNEFFQTIFRGPTISSNLFDIFNNFNSIRLFDISDVSAWDLAVDAEEHYRSDGRKINPGDPDHPYNKSVTESSNVLVSNEEFFEEFVSSKQRNREKKFLKERNFVPDKDNPNKGWIDSDFKDKNGKPKRIRFEINNDSVIASTNSEDRIQMTRKALRTHPGISSADFKHEEGHMFAKQKYKEWAKSHPKPEDMSLEDHMNEFYKSGEFKDFFTRVSKDLEKAAEKGMTEHGKNLEEYFADAFALANSLNESMDIKSIRTMGSRINSNKEYNKLLNRFNANVDNITNYVAKNMIATVSNDIKWIKDCPEDIRNNEHFKKLRKAISDCQLYKNLIQIEERTKEFDRGLINIFNSSLNDFKSLHDQKSIEAKAKLKQNKEELMVKIKKQDEKIQSMKAELKIKKKFVEDCKKDIHNLYKASAAANSNLTNMQKEIIDDVKKSQKVLNNEIEFRAKMLEKLSKDEKNQLKIKESYSVLISNEEFFSLMK